MTEIASLKIRVDALEAKAATDALNKMSPAAGKAEKSVKGVSSASSALNKVLGITAGLLSARQILQAAESWTTLNNRLRLVADSSAAFNMAQENIFRIAQDTRQGLTATAELYQRIAQNQKELGLTGQETADIVQTINQALVVSGTAGAGAQAALVQLGQAFASGTLRGEELNAVLEQAPALAQAIARGMGVTVGQLRALGAEGVLTAQSVVQALQSQAQAVEDQFTTMAPTVSGALTQLDNSFIQLVGRMDESSGATETVSKAINKLSIYLSDPKTIEAAQNFATKMAEAFSGIVDASIWVVETIRWMAEEAAVAMGGIAGDDVDRLNKKLQQLEDQASRIQESGGTIQQWMIDDMAKYGDMLQNALNTQRDMAAAPPPVSTQQAEVTKTVTQKVVELGGATKKLSDEQRAAIKAANELERAQKSNVDVIADLAESLYQATLPADALAQRQAELRLNEYATKEQVASVKQLSLALVELQEAEKAKQDLEQRRAAFGSNSEQTIRGNVTPLSGGAFDDQTARYEAERQAEELRYQEQQARLTEALELELITREQYANLEVEMRQVTADRIAQIESARNDMMLTSAASAFGQMSTDLMSFAQLFGEEQKEMFAIAKAAAIAQTIIQTYQGAQQAFTALSAIPVVGPALGVAAAAAAVAGGLARVSAITSQQPSFDGGGFTGGGARAGGLDGKGGFMAMMHPNETVIDHTKGQQMPGGGMTNVISITVDSGGTEVTTGGADSQSVQLANSMRAVVVDELERQNRQGGILWTMRNQNG